MNPLGIFGGTFNPVHFGHLRPVLELREFLKLEEVRMIPCNLPAHRTEPGVSSKDRMAMLKYALAQTHGLVADSRELDREGYSYTVDTLSTFQEDFPDRELILIVGSDAFSGFTQWHQWRKILDLCNLVVMKRPNSVLSEPATELLSDRRESSYEQCIGQVGRIVEYSPTYLDISSTQIRLSLTRGNAVDYLIPLSVKGYIERHQLYASSQNHKLKLFSKNSDKYIDI